MIYLNILPLPFKEAIRLKKNLALILISSSKSIFILLELNFESKFCEPRKLIFWEI